MRAGRLSRALIVFDLDGTLVDTAPDLHRALNHVLISEGLAPARLEDTRRHIGKGARALIDRSARQANTQFSKDKLNQLTETFIQVYAEDIAGHSRVFPGVEAALDDLSNAGARFAVCTNKRTNLSKQLLQAVGLADRFSAIVGADAVKHSKPHPDHYLETVANAGGNVKHSLMVGDSSADVGAARAAGAPVILVSFGYTDTAPTSLGADTVIDHFQELPGEVEARLAPRII
ncbi:MAG: phosphoglycolate phosphatase [Pseudomonadota bacterium]